MKLLKPREVKRLFGRDMVIFQTGAAYSTMTIKRLPFWKKIKFVFSK